MLRCDGCDILTPHERINMFVALGHQMRYCPACTDIYRDFVLASEAIGAKYQRMLDDEETVVRLRCPLKLTPLDMPRLILDAKNEAVTLG